MAKKPDAPQPHTGELKHNPFAGLAKQAHLVAKQAAVVRRTQLQKPLPVPKIRMRLESAGGRSGKVVTRITGLPPENIETIAQRLRKCPGYMVPPPHDRSDFRYVQVLNFRLA